MLTPFIFLVAPRKVYDILKLKSQWIAPIVLTVLGLVGKVWIENPWRSQTLIFQTHSLYISIVSVTIFIIALWSVIAAFLYLSIFLMDAGNGVTFNNLFSIVAYCGIIMMLDEISNVLLVRTNVIDSALFALPHRFPIGLDILVSGASQNSAWGILLHSVNPFIIWYFIYLSIGLSIVTGLSKIKTRTLSFFLWFIAVGFIVSIYFITGETRLHIRFGNY
jgi:hypothetical protein